MISELSSATGDLVKAVLDVSLIRHRIIANNIANQNTQGFVPQQVNFESILASELSNKNSISDDAQLREGLAHSGMSIEDRAVNMIGGKPEKALDIEMSDMVKNALRYQALITGLGKLSSINHMAITGGRK